MINIQNIIKELKTLSDPDRKLYGEKSYPTKMKILGVKVPELKNITKEIIKEIKHLTKNESLKHAKSLIETNIFECQQIAYEAISNDKNIMSTLTFKDIQELGKNLDNWLSVDMYAGLLVGHLWRDNRITDNTIQQWAKSEDFWMRRTAVVATVALNQKARGGEGDPKRTLEICSIVVNDKEDMVIKSLSWALRELAKRDTKPVKDFITKHKKVLHPKVLREVSKKIETGRK